MFAGNLISPNLRLTDFFFFFTKIVRSSTSETKPICCRSLRGSFIPVKVSIKVYKKKSSCSSGSLSSIQSIVTCPS